MKKQIIRNRAKNTDGSWAFGDEDGAEAKAEQKISNEDATYLRENPDYLAQLTAKSKRKFAKKIMN